MGKASEYQPGKDYSRRELLQLAQELGWSVVKKGQKGKSGHVTCIKDGCLPFDIPTDPGKKTTQKILKQMGLKK